MKFNFSLRSLTFRKFWPYLKTCVKMEFPTGAVFWIVLSCPALISSEDGFTKVVNMENSAPAGLENKMQAISYKNSKYLVHYYRFVKYSQTWISAKDVCESAMFSNRPGGCYLMYPDDEAETHHIDTFLETPQYNPSVWVNLLTGQGQIYDGRTNRSVYYPPKSKVEFVTRAKATSPDDVLIQSQIEGSWFDFQDWPSNHLANFFCECEDVCQPGVYACHDACCEASRERCDVIDEYTASCFCPKGDQCSFFVCSQIFVGNVQTWVFCQKERQQVWLLWTNHDLATVCITVLTMFAFLFTGLM